jgi:hypothetical protein
MIFRIAARFFQADSTVRKNSSRIGRVFRPTLFRFGEIGK